MGDERQARRQGGAVWVTRDKRGAREGRVGDERQARRQGGAVWVTRDKRGAREEPCG